MLTEDSKKLKAKRKNTRKPVEEMTVKELQENVDVAVEDEGTSLELPRLA